MLGDAVFDNMMSLIKDLRGYTHANNKKNKVIIMELLANMHNTVRVLDWGEDYTGNMEDSRKAVLELWNEYDEDDHS